MPTENDTADTPGKKGPAISSAAAGLALAVAGQLGVGMAFQAIAAALHARAS